MKLTVEITPKGYSVAFMDRKKKLYTSEHELRSRGVCRQLSGVNPLNAFYADDDYAAIVEALDEYLDFACFELASAMYDLADLRGELETNQ